MPCAIIPLPGGGTAHVRYSRRKATLCQFCRRRPHTKLCDFVLASGRTCDAKMCDSCAIHAGPDTDFCPDHQHTPPGQVELFPAA